GLVDFGWLGGEPTQTCAGIEGYRRDRLVDLMGDRGRHLAHEDRPVEALEIRVGLLQILLRPLALSDVVVGLQNPDRLPPRVALQGPAAGRNDPRAVSAWCGRVLLPNGPCAAARP